MPHQPNEPDRTHTEQFPYCFVLMPFGRKPDARGRLVDFDEVYRQIIAPAVEDAKLAPIRADEERVGGVIHKAMFERLVLCDFAVADLTTANANVYYELGVRHAIRPWTTALLYAADDRLPFDLASMRAIQYELTSDGLPANAETSRQSVARFLVDARSPTIDSPVFQMVDGLPAPQLDHAKTDDFRERVQYAQRVKDELAAARKSGLEAIRAVEQTLQPIKDAESAVVIDLYLSYRAVSAWAEMVRLVERMSEPLARTVLVQEQLGLALNRLGERDRAERILVSLIERRGPSSETYGLLGRVYKDKWDEAAKAGRGAEAHGLLRKAIDAYLRGFNTDWRDAYPGINAVTLMALRDPPDDRLPKLLPVVAYAAQRRVEDGVPDYWDHATLLELAILAKDEPAAQAHLGDALASVREAWEPQTTAGNLRLIRKVRERRGEQTDWAATVERQLEETFEQLEAGHG